jgi:hypothetical protein
VQKIRKKYLIHGKLLLNRSLGLCTPQKTSFYAFFWPQNRPMPEKWVITVYAISHGRSIFAHIQVGELGGSEGWGESRYTGRKSVHGKIVAVYLPIVGLTDL